MSILSLQESLRSSKTSEEKSTRIDAISAQLDLIFSKSYSHEEALISIKNLMDSIEMDPIMRALIMMERSIINFRSGRSDEGRVVISQLRSQVSLAGDSLIEARINFIVGARLASMEMFEDAAIYLEEAINILDSHSIEGPVIQILEESHLVLMGIYNSIGHTDKIRSELEQIRLLSSKGGNILYLRLAEDLATGHQYREYKGTEVTFTQLLDSMKAVTDASRDIDSNPWKNFGKEMEALLDILQSSARGKDKDAFIEAIVSQKDSDSAIGQMLMEIVPALDHFKDGRQDEGIRILADFVRPFIDQPIFTRLQRIEMKMLTALSEDDPMRAAEICEEQIDEFESFISEMQVHDFASGIVDERGYWLYQNAIQIFSDVDPEGALHYAEKGRAWSLRRLIGNVPADRQIRDPEEKEILGKLSEMHRAWRAGNQVPAVELNRLRNEYEVLRIQRLLKTNRKSGNGRHLVSAISPGKLRKEVLDSNSTLILYYFTNERMWIWTVEKGGINMASMSSPGGKGWRDYFQCQIEAIRRSKPGLETGTNGNIRGANILSNCSFGDHGIDLYQLLVAPVRRFINTDNLIIVPHGILHEVPYAALYNYENRRYLIEDFKISVTPSASVLALLSKREKSLATQILVLGDPSTPFDQLTFASEEAVSVARLTGGSLLLHKEARESVLYEKAGDIRLLHLAAHGQYVPRNPFFSRMLLSADGQHDGLLEMHEVWDQLDLQGTQLVVLSGCDTALGEISRGDEIVGLTHAFLKAGSRSVISTLWPVDDVASAKLMENLYRRFVSEGVTVAEALRAAQLEILNQRDTGAPYFWAGYTLSGDPKAQFSP